MFLCSQKERHVWKTLFYEVQENFFFFGLVILVQHRNLHMCFKWKAKFSKQEQWYPLHVVLWETGESYLHHFGEWRLLLLGHWEVHQKLLWKTICQPELKAVALAASQTQEYKMFPRKVQKEEIIHKLPLSSLKRITVSSWKYFRDIYCILKISFYF